MPDTVNWFQFFQKLMVLFVVADIQCFKIGFFLIVKSCSRPKELRVQEENLISYFLLNSPSHNSHKVLHNTYQQQRQHDIESNSNLAHDACRCVNFGRPAN